MGRSPQKVQSSGDDQSLCADMERDPEVVTHPERYEDRAGRFDPLGHVARHGDGHRGDATAFDCALNQSDRLVADGSSRAEQSDVGLLVDHRLREVLSERVLQQLRVHVVADEGEEVSCQLANDPLAREVL